MDILEVAEPQIRAYGHKTKTLIARKVECPGFENIVHFTDRTANLNAIISVHSTRRGPALGGCRMYPYATFDDALNDVQRLSEGMTYKIALTGLPFGGGKSVIIADPKTQKTPQLLHAFGAALNLMNGTYLTAEDVGTSPADMAEVARVSDYVSGLIDPERGSGDPSPTTAFGVYCGIKEAVRFKLGKPSVKGISVCVLGLGHVGYELCRLLHRDGATLTVSDIDGHKMTRAINEFGARTVAPDSAIVQPADVFAPCALGGIINPQTVGRLRAPIIAGAANNQLSSPEMGVCLAERGILYAPDYVINAGGVIRVCNAALGRGSEQEIRADAARIALRLREIFQRADIENLPTSAIADTMAMQRLEDAPCRVRR